MADLAALQADPKFQALPPERQQLILSHLGSNAPKAEPPKAEGLAQKVGDFYKNDIAQPLTQAIGAGLDNLTEHPFGVMNNPLENKPQATMATPFHQLSPFAQEVAQFVVPQTATSAALTAGSMLLPEAKIAQKLGEAAGPVARVLGTRPGRIGAMTGLGAATGAATGEGALSGAAQGAGTTVPGEAIAGAAGMVGRRLGEGSLIRKTTADFGKALMRQIPWVGKLEKGSDFANAFIHGGAVEKAGNLLNSVKTTLGRRVQGHLFNIPIPTAQGVEVRALPFHEADALITQMQDHGFGVSGDPRGGVDSPNWRKLALQTRDRIANKLNDIQRGLGDSYLKARKQFDISKTLTKMFKKEGLFVEGGLHQPELIGRMNKYAGDLDRSLGKSGAKDLLNTLRRGFVGEATDTPSKAATLGAHGSPFGVHFYAKPGHSYQAIGDAGALMNPPAGPIEAGLNEAIGMASAPDENTGKGPGVKSLEASRAEAIAPTPSAAKRATEVTKDLGKGKNPEVHADLQRGRLSLDEVNKLVANGAKTDAMAMLDHVPISEAMDAVEVANPEERKMLLPLIQQKMRDSFKGQNFNRTLASSLARRLQKLQAEV